jgi:hypothetical protein
MFYHNADDTQQTVVSTIQAMWGLQHACRVKMKLAAVLKNSSIALYLKAGRGRLCLTKTSALVGKYKIIITRQNCAREALWHFIKLNREILCECRQCIMIVRTHTRRRRKDVLPLHITRVKQVYQRFAVTWIRVHTKVNDGTSTSTSFIHSASTCQFMTLFGAWRLVCTSTWRRNIIFTFCAHAVFKKLQFSQLPVS